MGGEGGREKGRKGGEWIFFKNKRVCVCPILEKQDLISVIIFNIVAEVVIGEVVQ